MSTLDECEDGGGEASTRETKGESEAEAQAEIDRVVTIVPVIASSLSINAHEGSLYIQLANSEKKMRLVLPIQHGEEDNLVRALTMAIVDVKEQREKRVDLDKRTH